MGRVLPLVRQPSRKTCDLVDARDEYRCVRCGRSVYEVLYFSRHHRHMRSHPFKELHSAANLILLCGTGTQLCHGWIHAHPKEAMENGWLVSGFNDHPETVPILTAQHGWVLLNLDGTYTPVDTPSFVNLFESIDNQ